jgi:8-oxo-dGTP diphosphatase
MRTIKRAVAAIIFDKNREKILLLKRGPECRNEVGKWENPGGQIDPTILPEERAIERIREEIGVKIRIVKELFVSESKPDNTNTIWKVNLFEAYIIDGDPKPQQEAYCSEIRWIPIEELKSQNLASYTRKDFIQLGFIQPEVRGVAVIIYNDDETQVLLVQRGPDSRDEPLKWENPGGEIELGESAEDAAKREILEELGVGIEIRELLLPNDSPSDDLDILWSVDVYKGKITSGIPQPQERKKCTDIRWCSIKDLHNIDLATYAKRDFQKLGYL